MWKPIILDVECIVCNKSLQKINHDPRNEVTQNMGKVANRRSRTPNWSVEEKQYLLELIKERKEIVVTKTTNGPNHYEEKDVAWNEILTALTTRFGNKFVGSSTKKVKTQWQNMKRIAREEITLNGPELDKYTKQSLEVCNILEIVKDGVLNKDHENVNMSNFNDTLPHVEIKTERIDEDYNQPSCSSNSNAVDTEQPNVPVPEIQNEGPNDNQLESSESSVSDQASEPNDDEINDEPPLKITKKNVPASTSNPSIVEDNVNPFHRNLQEFLRYSTTEKQLKLETLKEERQVVRAMRETAELTKIIAEQKLKHILWIKKQDMKMYSGEPGSGAGKGGGGGGAIREAGGSFGKMEAAREDEYFYKKQKEQLQNMKEHLNKEIAFHQEQIKRHEDAIRRHKEQMSQEDHKH